MEAGAPELQANVRLQRAAAYFGWFVGLVAMIALIGFVPAVGVFIVAYMRFGFGERWTPALVTATIVTLLCYAVFDRGLSVPWPQALLGDVVPWLRETTDLM